jgi:hypothetical protein
LQDRRVETFGEPVEDRREEITGFGVLDHVRSEASEAGRAAQFPQLPLLTARNCTPRYQVTMTGKFRRRRSCFGANRTGRTACPLRGAWTCHQIWHHHKQKRTNPTQQYDQFRVHGRLSLLVIDYTILLLLSNWITLFFGLVQLD